MTKHTLMTITLGILVTAGTITAIIFAYQWSVSEFYTITYTPENLLPPPPMKLLTLYETAETTSTPSQPIPEPYLVNLNEGEGIDIDSRYDISEESLTHALQSKTITDLENNITYTLYRFSNNFIDRSSITSTVLKISQAYKNSSKEVNYFRLPIADTDIIGEIGFIVHGIALDCDSTLNKNECTYKIRFNNWLPNNMVNINRISIEKVTPSPIRTAYFLIAKNISQKLDALSIKNMYTEIPGWEDTGVRYKMTFIDNPVYQLFIMSPDFAVGLGEGGPTSFTPNTMDFTGTAEEITDQLSQPGSYQERNLQYTEKRELNGLDTFWTFGDFGYASEEYAVQVLTEDKDETGYLIYISVPNAYKNNPQAGYESVKDSEFVRKILSVIE